MANAAENQNPTQRLQLYFLKRQENGKRQELQRERERDLSVEVVSWIGEITMQVGEEALAVGRRAKNDTVSGQEEYKAENPKEEMKKLLQRRRKLQQLFRPFALFRFSLSSTLNFKKLTNSGRERKRLHCSIAILYHCTIH